MQRSIGIFTAYLPENEFISIHDYVTYPFCSWSLNQFTFFDIDLPVEMLVRAKQSISELLDKLITMNSLIALLVNFLM